MFNFTRDQLRNLDLRLENFLNCFTRNTKYGAVVAIATSIVIISSTYIACRFAKRACCRQGKTEGIFTRSMSFGALHGGKLAMERLIDYHQARADTTSLNAAETELKILLAQEHPDFNKLQSAVAKLEMSGKEGIAVGILETEVNKAKKEKKSHEAYEIEMLLVEMLIYKGDYDKALTCECLSDHEEISDARRALYKAILHIMLDHPNEASGCWEGYIKVRECFQYPPSSQDDQFHKDITSFSEFERLVKLLQNDIDKGRTR